MKYFKPVIILLFILVLMFCINAPLIFAQYEVTIIDDFESYIVGQPLLGQGDWISGQECGPIVMQNERGKFVRGSSCYWQQATHKDFSFPFNPNIRRCYIQFSGMISSGSGNNAGTVLYIRSHSGTRAAFDFGFQDVPGKSITRRTVFAHPGPEYIHGDTLSFDVWYDFRLEIDWTKTSDNYTGEASLKYKESSSSVWTTDSVLKNIPLRVEDPTKVDHLYIRAEGISEKIGSMDNIILGILPVTKVINIRTGEVFTTIQSAIDAAVDGDTIIAKDGIYVGAGNRYIDFKGKAITLQSEHGAEKTIIDCENSARGFYFHSNETASSVVDGFTIRNGSDPVGGGIWCGNSSPLIINSIINNNFAHTGGGIFCNNSSMTITNCIINNNSAILPGGGGIYQNNSSLTMTNCTLSNNLTFLIGLGDGICCSGSSSLSITNCILWNKSSPEIYMESGSHATVTFSNIKGGYSGTGNINADPMFVDPNHGDYRLSPGSPCIDRGKNIEWMYSDIRGSLRPLDSDGIINLNNNFDMGAYEYTKPNDYVIKAFQEVKLIGYYGLIDYDSEIQWKSTGPFPENDERFSTDKKYRVWLALVDDDSRRIELGEVEASTGIENKTLDGYVWSHTVVFGPEHSGDWRIRIEMADDPHQYTESQNIITIKEPEENTWTIGNEIIPPPYADPNKEPQIEKDAEFAFYWSNDTKKLYAVAPINTAIIWKDIDDVSIPVFGANIWPDPNGLQIHVAGSPLVNLLPAGSDYRYVKKLYGNGIINENNQFNSTEEGYNVLIYWNTDDEEHDSEDTELKIEVIQTFLWNDPGILDDESWTIGRKVIYNGHECDCDEGYMFFKRARYDAEVYDRDSEIRQGPIIPVNKDDPNNPEDDFVVIWYQKGSTGVCWPYKPVRYDCQWPIDPDKIIIACNYGSGDLPENFQNIKIYSQPDPNLPGFNPNEEHALVLKEITESAIDYRAYALRNDLNRADTSDPYVLVKYQDSENNDEWDFKVYEVMLDPNYFNFMGRAGSLLNLPYPISTFKACMESYGHMESDPNDPGPFWDDYNGIMYGRSEGNGVLRLFYPLQEDFFYDPDRDGNPDTEVGGCVPWLSFHDGDTDTPIGIAYTITWPEKNPNLRVGETLLKAKNELPDIMPQCSVEVIFDQHMYENNNDPNFASVRLIEPLHQIVVDLEELPSKIKTQFRNGKKVFVDLPYHLRSRVSYDPLNEKLEMKGVFDDSEVGEPLLLPNILSGREKEQLLALSADSNYETAVKKLYDDSRKQLFGQTKLLEGEKALTAGAAADTGYVTLALGGDMACAPNPVSLNVFKVACPLYTGDIKVIRPDNVFDERVTMRHSGDFGGEPDKRTFQWKYSTSLDRPERPDEDPNHWLDFIPEPYTGEGAVDITIGGTGIQTITDKWFSCRYTGYDGICGEGAWSKWTEPQLYEGWIKRVVRELNPFEQRFKDFHETEINAYESMIIQAGERYEGDVALNYDPENLNEIGLIELYETVLGRGCELSIDALDPVDDSGANNALLLASSRIVDLYMLLGNEAYADAADPTIGFGTEDGVYGSEATTIFCFQNQLDSLLEEELSLLRGRDDSGARVDLSPVYNRLFWNYTSGLDGGEVAYSLNYNLKDQNEDGTIDEKDARIMFPQGHGDAWGHYLTAIKAYYRLLMHSHYTWVPRSESVLVAGTPVEVDYYDERKFAKAAAARAMCGSEIVDLTYRKHYVEDPVGQWQGYKDIDPDRAWGVSEWSCRAGQGAYFDWVVGNALLPPKDKVHTGLKKIDRTTVLEIHEVASHYGEIQASLDKADSGLNPLGIAKDAIPFDISPAEFHQDQGRTHFEQIYDRAVITLNNAIGVFNHANQMTQLLRRQQDTLEDFKRNVEDREADFNNRLIEIYGKPYPEDCGPSGDYSSDYEGPDILHFGYIETSLNPVQEFNVQVADYSIDPNNGALSKSTKDVKFFISTDPSGNMFVKPASWTSKRKATGEIQMALSDLLQTKSRFEQGLVNYDNLLDQIEDQAQMIEAQHNLNRYEILILNETHQQQVSLNSAIKDSRSRQLMFRSLGRTAVLVANAIAEALPLVCGAGGCDFTSIGRAAALTTGSTINEIMNSVADVESITELESQQAKETVQSLSNIKLTTIRGDFAIQQQISQLEQVIRQEASSRLELYILQENMQQCERRYLSALARGDRLQDELLRFRQQTAEKIQNYRYRDMAFRIFRNDALQKYRAQFDLAAMYVYLAAKAYDYETSLLSSESMAGQAFLTDIVRQRTIGLIEGGQPVTGTGLADPMARLWQNFIVLKPLLGFNNPQIETSRFSLRSELFRIGRGEDSNPKWREKLEECRVDNLWDIPEFRRYCKPFAPEFLPEKDPNQPIKPIKQPAIVIPFETNINFGMNFFGWPRGGGDSFYSPTKFAYKIKSVGIWFSNYSNLSMAQTPYVYLIPVGADMLRIPYTAYSLETREWKVVDQILPIPFPLSRSDWITNRSWIPRVDTLSEELAGIRRHPDFRAYHDSDYWGTSEMVKDTRLIGRSVWNTQWLLIIPSANLYWDEDNPEEGLNLFIHGSKILGSDDARTEYGVSDIKLVFETYSYSGS